MAKRVNYGQEKRQRELAKQKKKQRKEQQKAERRRNGDTPGEAPARGGLQRPAPAGSGRPDRS